MADEGNTGSAFRFETTLKPGEDHKEADTRWYRCDEEEKRWKFYGNERPSWDELSEDARDTLSSVYGLVFRRLYEKERVEAIGRGMSPRELPESPETTLEVLHYLDKAKKHQAED